MSTSNVARQEKSTFFTQVAILALFIALVVLALLSAYKLLVKEPTQTPQEMKIEEATKKVKGNPNNKNARLLLAYAYQEAKDFVKAEEQYNEALKIDPKEQAAIYNLGVIAKEQKEFGKAEKHFKKVLGLNKTHVLGAMGIAEVYILQKKYEDAVKVLDDIIKEQGHLVNPHLTKAQALEKMGKTEEARQEYTAVLRFVPDHKEAKEALERLK